MRLWALLPAVALAGCMGDFERSAREHQRISDGLATATLVVEYHRNGEDLARPDPAADQRVIDAFMAGCGKATLNRLDDALAREIPYAVLSKSDGQARMASDAAIFDSEVDRCFTSLGARGKVTWIVSGRELSALQVAGQVAIAMSYPEGHAGTTWAGIGGCGSRGGPGYRLSTGKCASWSN